MFEALARMLRTARADLRYQGPEVLAYRMLVKLLRPLAQLDVQMLYQLDLTQPVVQKVARLPCVVERAHEEHVEEILEMQLPTLTSEAMARLDDADEVRYAQRLRTRAELHRAYLRQLRMGEQCFVARVDGRVAHSNWTRLHDRGTDENCPVHLRPGEIYTTDGHTAEALRGNGLHEAVLTHMLRAAQQRGCHRAYTITDMTKAVSRRALRRVGWQRRGTILYVTPRGLRRRFLVRLGGDVEPLLTRARILAGSGE